jgi:transcriptional regulator with GAF, ATPase, and Fis domain
LETNYTYNSFWLVLSDKKSNLLQTSFCVSNTLSKDAIEYLKSLSFHPEDPLSICSTYREQKLVYRDKEDSLLSDSDHDILNKTEFSYLFHLPFVVYGECIGILTIHKADGEKIPLTEQERMSRFTDLISGAVYNSILFRDSQLAKEKAEESFQKANTLNDMIQVVIQSRSTDEIFTKIYDLFSDKYGLTSYLVYTYDDKDQLLKLYKLYGDMESSKEYLITLYKNHLSIYDSNSLHGICFRSKKSFLVKSVKLPHKYKPEEENIIEGGITSFYVIPLTSDGGSFGSITFSDNKFQSSNIKGLMKSDREEIENFVKLISPSIYQSLQKNIIDKAYSDLQTTKTELESQKAQIERLQAMSQEIQRKTSFEEMLRSLEEIIWESYKLGDFILYTLNPDTNQMQLYAVSRKLHDLGLMNQLKSVSLSEEKSLHRLIFQKKRFKSLLSYSRKKK